MNKTQFANEPGSMFWKTSVPVVFQDKLKNPSENRKSSANSRPGTKPRYFNNPKNKSKVIFYLSEPDGFHSLERKRTEPPFHMALIYLNPKFKAKTRQTKKRMFLTGVKTLKR